MLVLLEGVSRDTYQVYVNSIPGADVLNVGTQAGYRTGNWRPISLDCNECGYCKLSPSQDRKAILD